MAAGAFWGLVLLVSAALIFSFGEHFVPRARRVWFLYGELFVLAAALLLTVRCPWPVPFIDGGLSSPLEVSLAKLFLVAWAFETLVDLLAGKQVSLGQVPLRLLMAGGMLLASSARGLLAVWLGVVLFTVGRKNGVREVLGLLLALLGLVFIYASWGTLWLPSLEEHVWQRGSLQPLMGYLAVGTLLGGLALATGFLPPYAKDSWQEIILAPLLGMGVFLRLAQGGLGGLYVELFWAFCLWGLLACLWGLEGASRALGKERIGWLAVFQRGWLLMGLAGGLFTGEWERTWIVAWGYLLAQGLWQAGVEGQEEQLLPWGWLPLGVALLSLAGCPGLLGFWAKRTLLQAFREKAPWLFWMGVTLSLFAAWFYLRTGFFFARQRAESPPSWGVLFWLVVWALGLVLVGTRPDVLSFLY